MFDSLLSVLAPHHCYGCGIAGSVLCDKCKNYIIDHGYAGCVLCGRPLTHTNLCARHGLPFDALYCVAERTGALAALIDQFKFHRAYAAHVPLAELFKPIAATLSPKTVVVPVPTTPHNSRVRGYDHMRLIAARLAQTQGWRQAPLLQRRNNITQHLASSAQQRRRQAQEFFRVRGAVDATMPYLIVDDIFTTGATLSAAARCLRQAGARHVVAAILARQT